MTPLAILEPRVSDSIWCLSNTNPEWSKCSKPTADQSRMRWSSSHFPAERDFPITEFRRLRPRCKHSNISHHDSFTMRNTLTNEDKTTVDAPTSRTGLVLCCSRCHPAWASEGTLVGPGKDTHGTPVPTLGRPWVAHGKLHATPPTRQNQGYRDTPWLPTQGSNSNFTASFFVEELSSATDRVSEKEVEVVGICSLLVHVRLFEHKRCVTIWLWKNSFFIFLLLGCGFFDVKLLVLRIL